MVWSAVWTEGTLMRTNHQGNDGYVFVDVENDPDTYVFFEDESNEVQSMLRSLSQNPESNGSPSTIQKVEIWIKNEKPSEVDKCATEDFLKLMLEQSNYDGYFDNTTRKSVILERVANMMAKDYSFGNRKGVDVCTSKLKNLKASYNLFVENRDQTGNSRKEPPPHLELLHTFFGGRHSSVPVKIAESSSASRKQGNEREKNSEPGPSLTNAEVQQESDDEAATNHFNKASSSAHPKKPRVSHADILSALVNETNMRKEMDTKFLKEIRKQNKQRKQMISILAKLANTTPDDVDTSNEDE